MYEHVCLPLHRKTRSVLRPPPPLACRDRRVQPERSWPKGSVSKAKWGRAVLVTCLDGELFLRSTPKVRGRIWNLTRRGVLVWTMFLSKGPFPVRFHVRSVLSGTWTCRMISLRPATGSWRFVGVPQLLGFEPAGPALRGWQAGPDSKSACSPSPCPSKTAKRPTRPRARAEAGSGRENFPCEGFNRCVFPPLIFGLGHRLEES